ncbi:MAG: hypothetical protein E6Q88_10395 [Lysobacteraceae bacterium]|nr:MAG: hypothetical protein E6Q88_10395 [Xanthomonadaceae bacterium]
MKHRAHSVRVVMLLLSLLTVGGFSATAYASLSTAKWYYQGRVVSGTKTTIIGSGLDSLTLMDTSGTIYASYATYNTWRSIVCLPVDTSNIPACVVQSKNASSGWDELTTYRHNGAKIVEYAPLIKTWGIGKVYKSSTAKALVWLTVDTNWGGGVLGNYDYASRKIVYTGMPGGWYYWYSEWTTIPPTRRLPTTFVFTSMGTHNAVDVYFNVPNTNNNYVKNAPTGIYRFNNGAVSWIR